MNNKVSKALVLCSTLTLPSCHEANTSNETTKAAVTATAPDSATTSFPSVRRLVGVADSLDLCHTLLYDKTPQAFIQRQQLPFKLTTDTVSNDERGLYLGPKAEIGTSQIQWDEQNIVRRLFVDDDRITLNYGIKVGMDKRQLMHLLGAKDKADSFDTLGVDGGFLQNGCYFIFKGDNLVSISLDNESD